LQPGKHVSRKWRTRVFDFRKETSEAVHAPTSENLGSSIVKLQILTWLELKWSGVCDSFGALRSCSWRNQRHDLTSFRV